MPFLHPWPLLLPILLSLTTPLLRPSNGDVYIGTASRYHAPYLPTECYGDDGTELPSSNFFGAAGRLLWGNGELCGKEYEVKCISARPGSCNRARTIRVKIVDSAFNNQTNRRTAASTGQTLLLSEAAFSAIADAAAVSINIEYQPL